MVDNATIRLMAQIMQEGMTGFKIADLFHDANSKYNFYNKTFEPPNVTHERKENYANRWLDAMKDKGWDEAIIYIAEQLLDKTRVYFTEDNEHPYPKKRIARLREKLFGTKKKSTSKKKQLKEVKKANLTHGKTLKKLLSCLSNEGLQECLYQDIRDVENCINAGAWKPAVIMCGSILEAILFDWLEQQDTQDVKNCYSHVYPNNPCKSIRKMTLQELICVAEDMSLIHGYYRTISDGIRNFRNLIHPTLSIREEITPNKAIAEIGRQIVFAILQERNKI